MKISCSVRQDGLGEGEGKAGSGKLSSIGNKNHNSVFKVPNISEEDKELKDMATTVEKGVRQDMVSTKSQPGISHRSSR